MVCPITMEPTLTANCFTMRQMFQGGDTCRNVPVCFYWWISKKKLMVESPILPGKCANLQNLPSVTVKSQYVIQIWCCFQWIPLSSWNLQKSMFHQFHIKKTFKKTKPCNWPVSPCVSPVRWVAGPRGGGLDRDAGHHGVGPQATAGTQ